jgi:CubicO group peptidase (beta-lactamase class C family)
MSFGNEVVVQQLEKIVPSKSPSVHYSFFNTNSTIFDHYCGHSDLKKKTRLDENSTFHYFSNTKTFTAVAILQLQEQGLISISDSVSKHLPNLPYPKEVTIKHLLNHSSGIPNPIPLSWIHLYTEDCRYDHEKFARKIIAENPKTKFNPNQKYAYSNIEYLILSLIIEKASGMNYRSYLEKNIFTLIGNNKQEIGFKIDSNSQTIGYHNKRSFTNLLLGFFLDKKKFMSESIGKWKPFNHFQLNGHGYSGVIATHSAMVSFIQELLKENSKLLSKSSKEIMFKENMLANNKKSGMCLSWFKGELNETIYFTHAGGGGGYYSEIRIYPSKGVGSVISFNRSGMKDERILDQFDHYFLNK